MNLINEHILIRISVCMCMWRTHMLWEYLDNMGGTKRIKYKCNYIYIVRIKYRYEFGSNVTIKTDIINYENNFERNIILIFINYVITIENVLSNILRKYYINFIFNIVINCPMYLDFIHRFRYLFRYRGHDKHYIHTIFL